MVEAPLSGNGEARTALQEALAALKGRGLTPEALLEGILFALQRHAWALPSPLEAVSLYDFARTHAAIAAALALNPAGELCLIGGDLSGVQEFIYSVSARGATRQLRGRSLYLQLLTDACAHAVLEAGGMPLCNLLYAGGGRFYVLLPSTAMGQLPALRRQLGRVLLSAHQGALYLALGGVVFRPSNYGSAAWENLSDAIEEDKRRRFATLDRDSFAQLFEPQQPPPPRDEADETEPLDQMGESLEKLGSALNRAALLAAEPAQPRTLTSDAPWYSVLASLGLGYRTLDEDQGYLVSRTRRRLLLLDDDPLPTDLAIGIGDVIGLRYTVAEAPRTTLDDIEDYRRYGLEGDGQDAPHMGDVRPFNLLAAQSEGVKRLAVLRMDVDDLGELFGRRLMRAEGVAALAVTAALSAALSRFFEGWIGALCRQQNAAGSGGVYAVYSGGDDLFLVGSWHRIPGLARQIREDFTAYVLGRGLVKGETPPLSLSAGITLIDAGYPLYQAADDAAEALDAAKAFSRPDGRRKDAVTFLGRTLGWEQFAEAEALCAELKGLIERGVSRGLLMTIQHLDASYRQRRPRTRAGDTQFAYGPWVWQGAYQLTRMAERVQGEAQTQIEHLRERIVGAAGVRDHTIERAGLAARWAQLLIRDRSRQKEER
jgi:CRISPR-associated protein Csm1